ncbi:hypothetical protein [Mesorhizobium sp. CN2-181]|uniref:hypothetical protein n=1 Tax=Mesorhizobium yinganensis TaxID=3157707 RepID=UPI0032B7EB17
MKFYGIADPEQLAMLTTTLDEYCLENGFDPSSSHREEAAFVLVAAFKSGASTVQELRARLDASAYRNEGELRRTG